MTNTPSNHIIRQPYALYLLSIIKLWERFGFHTVRVSLVLYLTQVLSWSSSHAYLLTAAFSALLYLAPLMGGVISDRYLTVTGAIFYGGVLLCLGYLLLSIEGKLWLHTALSLVITGDGLFMPNIAALVSELYSGDDYRRDGGFSLFYTAINIGAFIPPLIITIVIKYLGWSSAFLMAAISAFLAILLMALYRKLSLVITIKNINLSIVIVFLIVLFAILLKHTVYANICILLAGISLLIYVSYRIKSYNTPQKRRLYICLLLIFVSILFGMLFQQAGLSLIIFTKYNVDRHFILGEIPIMMFQSFNPLFVILFGPFLAKVWEYLAAKGLNPSFPTKFSLGSLLIGTGFLLLAIVLELSNSGTISSSWLILNYLFQTFGELLIAPIGLSMVSELSPTAITGLMMGVWYFSTAMSDILAGIASSLTELTNHTHDPTITAPIYAHVFGGMGGVAILAGIILLILVPIFKDFIKNDESKTIEQ